MRSPLVCRGSAEMAEWAEGRLERLSYREGRSGDGGLRVRGGACVVEAVRGKGAGKAMEEEEDGWWGKTKNQNQQGGGDCLSFGSLAFGQKRGGWRLGRRRKGLGFSYGFPKFLSLKIIFVNFVLSPLAYNRRFIYIENFYTCYLENIAIIIAEIVFDNQHQ